MYKSIEEWTRWTMRMRGKLEAYDISIHTVAGHYVALAQADLKAANDARRSRSGNAARPDTRVKAWLHGAVPRPPTAYRLGEALRLAAIEETGAAWTSGLASLSARGSWDQALTIAGLALERPGLLRRASYDDALVAAEALRRQLYHLRSGDDAGLAAKLWTKSNSEEPRSPRFRAAVRLAHDGLIKEAINVLSDWRFELRPYFAKAFGEELEGSTLRSMLRSAHSFEPRETAVPGETVMLAAYLLDEPARVQSDLT